MNSLICDTIIQLTIRYIGSRTDSRLADLYNRIFQVQHASGVSSYHGFARALTNFIIKIGNGIMTSSMYADARSATACQKPCSKTREEYEHTTLKPASNFPLLREILEDTSPTVCFDKKRVLQNYYRVTFEL
jgi:hypothetical protein